MKKCMIKTLILRHFDQTCKTILKINLFNYVNNEVLSQYDDEKTLHSVIFYSKNLSFAECNYEIYDKKLLIIIQVFEHWWSELKLTDISIKTFIDHQALMSLMKDKKLSRQQMHWVQKLADFNFKIMYWFDKQNIKINELTCWVNVVLKDFKNERCYYQWIMILTLNRMKIADLKKDVSQSINWQILKINRIDENCTLLREVISRDETQCKDIRLKSCIKIIIYESHSTRLYKWI